MSWIAVPEVLREKLGPEGAQALVELLNRTLGGHREDLASLLDSRFHALDARLDARFEAIDSRFEAIDSRFEAIDSRLDRLDARLQSLESRVGRLESRFPAVEERFERRLAEGIVGLRGEMAAFESRVTRWMFIFWVGQIGALTAILFAFFRP